MLFDLSRFTFSQEVNNSSLEHFRDRLLTQAHSKHRTFSYKLKFPRSPKHILHLSCFVFFVITPIVRRYLLVQCFSCGSLANHVVGKSWKGLQSIWMILPLLEDWLWKGSFHLRGWPNLVKSSWRVAFIHVTKPELNTESEKSAWRGMIPILTEVYRTGLLK
jgi:hypothetical protein